MAETGGGVAALSSLLSVAFDTLTDREHEKFLEHRNFDRGLIQELKKKMMAFSLIFEAAEERQFGNEHVRKWLLRLKDATYEAEDVLDGIQIEYQAHQLNAVSVDQSEDPLNQDLEPKLREILHRLADLQGESAVFGLRKARPLSFEFDVFLNFRGDDVRYNFLPYLKDALQEENIKTFYDQEDLRKGENVSAILEKIEASKMAIMIFSKGYASSWFCLKELVKILECREAWGHKAFPVFYNVHPNVVTEQSGSYKEAFEDHENKRGKDSEEVLTWRASLAEAAGIVGQHLQNKREEKIDIGEIVVAAKKLLEEFDLEKRSSEKRERTSLIDKSAGFYGRDADKKAIIDMLISDDDNGSKPGVIPIVGMGGVGKTTLARHVYNDKAVEKLFKIQAWICVSFPFDEIELTKQIVEKVTRKACPYGDLDRLQHKLKDVLNGEKFLLVLDDVWSEDYEKWRQLLIPLRFGAKGSKIIVTTRSTEVASKVQTVPPYDLRVLGDEDCQKLFVKHACLDVNSTANPRELQEIGLEIVRKCKGLPLAAKVLGGVLRWQRNVEKWKQVLKSEIWEVQNANILPSLAVSYIHLPSHLKRCFAYCAIFPQDYEFKKEKLVALWMSEGFLVQGKGNQSWEEIGDIYFDDLVSRSFFEQKYNYFVMHDLIHDLARFVSGEFCSRLDDRTSPKIGQRTRHLSYGISEHFRKKFECTQEAPFLRSFVFAVTSWYVDRPLEEGKLIHELLPTWKILRVLSLSRCVSMEKLPNSIDNLKHMRHLDISGTFIRSLPEAVTTLFNLEILILRDCIELVELPADMARLINLCQLDLDRTHRLKGMPPEMGKLKKLSKLSDFVVGENGGSSIKELGHLHYLRGQISIRELQNVKDDGDASEVILKDNENLKVLKLSWFGFADDSGQGKQVLERLQPHIYIECIEIDGYGGREFPNWVGDVSFSKLKELTLNECKNCICLPPLGQLASLEELNISSNAVLEAIGLEFYGMCKPGEKPFSSLKRLKFRQMRNWREWSSFSGAFPVLEELELYNCPMLMSVPDHLPSLKRLQIQTCGELDFEILWTSTRATLESINIHSDEKVKCISVETFPSLKELHMINCSNLESLGSTATRKRRRSDPLFPPSLTELSIQTCSKLVSFPRGLHTPNLKSMLIYECGNLKSLPQDMHSLLPSLENLSIYDCPEIESFPEGGLPSQLQSLEIVHCDKLVKSSFPEETLLPSSLKSLFIEGFKKMKSLNYKGLRHLSSLQSLKIGWCENLESLPEEGLPSSLSSLEIHFCPLLGKRCKQEIGEDWPKIKDIPHFHID